MFGISAGKLFVLIGAVIGVFVMIRTIKRIREWVETRERLERERARETARAPATAELVRCTVCGEYAAAEAGSCHREGCPRRGRRLP